MTMFVFAILLGVVSAAAVVGALVVASRDGYRRVPVRRHHEVV